MSEANAIDGLDELRQQSELDRCSDCGLGLDLNHTGCQKTQKLSESDALEIAQAHKLLDAAFADGFSSDSCATCRDHSVGYRLSKLDDLLRTGEALTVAANSRMEAQLKAIQSALIGESGDIVPTQIGKQAWGAAMVIDGEVNSLLAECGLNRKEGESKLITATARFVQLAINSELDKVRAAVAKVPISADIPENA
jgi:hypothetical protein